MFILGIIISPIINGDVLCKLSSVKQTKGVFWVPGERGFCRVCLASHVPPPPAPQTAADSSGGDMETARSRTARPVRDTYPPARTGQGPRLTNDSDTKNTQAWAEARRCTDTAGSETRSWRIGACGGGAREEGASPGPPLSPCSLGHLLWSPKRCHGPHLASAHGLSTWCGQTGAFNLKGLGEAPWLRISGA